MSINLTREQEWVLLEIAGELPEAEREHLNLALERDPDLQRFQAQAIGDDALAQVIVVSTDEAAQNPPMPKAIYDRLERNRSELLERDPSLETLPFPQPPLGRRLKWVAAMAAVLVGLLVLIGPQLGRLLTPQSGSSAQVATIPPAWAPRGATAVTEPLIIWDSAPDQSYDVWILPASGDVSDVPALFIKKGVRSPLAFDQLESATPGNRLVPGEAYRVLVCLGDQGRLAGEAVAFTIMDQAGPRPPVPATVDDALTIVLRLESVGRFGEALMVLELLPPEDRNEPTVEAARRRLQAAFEQRIP